MVSSRSETPDCGVGATLELNQRVYDVQQCRVGDVLVVACTTDNTDGMFGFQSGARISRAPAFATSTRLPPGS
jgi:hypothetical protein